MKHYLVKSKGEIKLKISCKIDLEYKNQEIAKTVFQSVKVDNFDFIKSKVEKNQLSAEIKSKSVSSLIHTLDDFLACVSVATNVVDKS